MVVWFENIRFQAGVLNIDQVKPTIAQEAQTFGRRERSRPPKPYLFSANGIPLHAAATMELGRNSLRAHTYNALLGLLTGTGRCGRGEAIRNGSRYTLRATPPI